jgi:hypothetical protein
VFTLRGHQDRVYPIFLESPQNRGLGGIEFKLTFTVHIPMIHVMTMVLIPMDPLIAIVSAI